MRQHLIEIAEDKAGALLDIWSWLLGRDAKILAVTVFGDMFLVDATGRVSWLDTLEGKVTLVASTRDEWRLLAAKPEIVDEWFWPGFAESLGRSGVHLEASQCYGWTIHPLIGGALELSNLAPIDIVAYHSIVSSLHRVPPGTAGRKLTVDGAEP